MNKTKPYNPLAKGNLGESVALALLRAPVRPLDVENTKNLLGAGVYAIYYVGKFPPYSQIRASNLKRRFALPIYVGKAVPRGARKGGSTLDAGSGNALRNRLRKHATSIREAKNLEPADFYYRALTVDDIWIPLGEHVLIEKFQPLWNRVIDGFGNNTPGELRKAQKRSAWDALHPGRKFVRKLKLAQHPLTRAKILSRISAFFAGELKEAEKIPVDDDEADEE